MVESGRLENMRGGHDEQGFEWGWLCMGKLWVKGIREVVGLAKHEFRHSGIVTVLAYAIIPILLPSPIPPQNPNAMAPDLHTTDALSF